MYEYKKLATGPLGRKPTLKPGEPGYDKLPVEDASVRYIRIKPTAPEEPAAKAPEAAPAGNNNSSKSPGILGGLLGSNTRANDALKAWFKDNNITEAMDQVVKLGVTSPDDIA